MKRLVLAVAAMVWAVGAMADGNALIGQCQSAIELVESKRTDDLYGAGRCAGLVTATVETVTIMNSFHNVKPAICFPAGGIPPIQMVRVVVKYLKNNPATLDQNESSLVILAVLESFPCKS